MNGSDKIVDGLRHIYKEVRNLSPRPEDLDKGFYRTRKGQSRSAWLDRIGMVWTSKIRYVEGQCVCGGDHKMVALVDRDGEVKETLCPVSLWLRICAAVLEKENGAAMSQWAKGHPLKDFLKKA